VSAVRCSCVCVCVCVLQTKHRSHAHTRQEQPHNNKRKQLSRRCRGRRRRKLLCCELWVFFILCCENCSARCAVPRARVTRHTTYARTLTHPRKLCHKCGAYTIRILYTPSTRTQVCTTVSTDTLLRLSAYYLLCPAIHYTPDSPHAVRHIHARHRHTEHTQTHQRARVNTQITRDPHGYTAYVEAEGRIEPEAARDAPRSEARPRAVEQHAAARKALLTERAARGG
jgi:hypothetical protein